MLLKKIKQVFILLIFSLIVLPIKVEAAALPSGVVIGDETGLTVEHDGIYFIEEKDMLPGHRFSREVSIGNYSQIKEAVTLNLLINPDDKDHLPIIKGKENLFEVIDMKLTLNKKVIYEGSIDGTGKNNSRNKAEPLLLGVYKPGDVATLKIDFVVKNEVDDEKWREANSVEFFYAFYANKEPDTSETTEDSITPPINKEKPAPPGKKDPLGEKPIHPFYKKLPPGLAGILPQTGEELATMLLGIATGFLIIILAIRVLGIKKSKN